jgi:hypothetical protein
MMPYKDPTARKAYHKAYGEKYVEENRARHNQRARVNIAAARERDPERFRALDKQRRPAGSVKLLLMKARQRATQRGMPFELTEADISIPEFCPLLDIPLFGGKGKWCANSPTIDRIDNTLGYVPSNVWVISWRANELKGDATVDELTRLADRLKLFIALRRARSVGL